MSDNKNGLFDSDDEDDVQYNPDEGEPEENLDRQPVTSTSVPFPAPTPAPYADTKGKGYSSDEEEDKVDPQSTSDLGLPPASAPGKGKPGKVPVKPASAIEEKSDFSVTDPINTGHVTYTVKGKDSEGDFEGKRRYNDFHHLRNALLTRWPGWYVPNIPAKKAVGNKDDRYIEHRRYFLQRFLRKVGDLSHILNSDEFHLFARPSGDIEKMIAMLPRWGPENIIEKYKKHLHIDEYPDDFLLKRWREDINEFNAFCKKVMPILRSVKENASKMVPTKSVQNENYKTLMESMWKFEENGLSQYVGGNNNNLVVGDPYSPELKKQWEELSEKLTNPFLEFYNWITGEIMDVEALQDAIHGRDKTFLTKQKIESKKRSDTDELNKLNQGKKTLKTLFKSSSGKQAKITDLSNSISQAEKDIEEYDKLIKMIEVHLGETVIPAFKESQMKHYYNICQNIAMLEIDDANKVAKFWSGFLENSNLKSA